MAKTTKKRPRAPKTSVSTDDSRGFDALPDWVKPTIWPKIVPSLIRHFGAQDDPWDLDGPSKEVFLSLLEKLLKKYHPNVRREKLSRKDKIYVYVSCSRP